MKRRARSICHLGHSGDAEREGYNLCIFRWFCVISTEFQEHLLDVRAGHRHPQPACGTLYREGNKRAGAYNFMTLYESCLNSARLPAPHNPSDPASPFVSAPQPHTAPNPPPQSALPAIPRIFQPPIISFELDGCDWRRGGGGV